MQIDRPIAIILIVASIICLVFFLVMPEYNKLGQLQTEFSEKNAEYNAQFDYYATITKTFGDLKVHQDDLKKIDDALPKGPVFGELIYFLQETAKKNGLIIGGMSFSGAGPSADDTNVDAGDTVKDISISMNALGDYPSLEGFMTALEKSSRIFEISSISFSYGSGTQYNFALQIKTHSY